MDISNLKRDLTSREEGEWVSDIPNLGEIKLKVRGLNSSTFRTLYAKKEKALPMTERLADGSPTAEANKSIVIDCIAEGVLLDWEGFTSEGKALKFSVDTAKKYLKDPNFELFADAVTWAARVVDNGKAIIKEETEKKLSQPS